MSYYFTLQTADRFPTLEIAKEMGRLGAAWVGDEPGDKVFYIPGKSLRGVCIYAHDDHIEIGLNAFTTADDARLMRDVVACAGQILKCPILPESEDRPIAADQVTTFCDEAWVSERHGEAHALLRMIADQPADEAMKIAGYARGFAISGALLARLREQGLSDTEAIAALMRDGIVVQDIDRTEDIYVAKPMSFTTPVEKTKRGFFGTKTVRVEETFLGFPLPPGVRTLTPVLMSAEPQYAIMGNEEYGYRRVPYDVIITYARQNGAREYGVGVFDLTINGDPYNDLFWHGEAM